MFLKFRIFYGSYLTCVIRLYAKCKYIASTFLHICAFPQLLTLQRLRSYILYNIFGKPLLCVHSIKVVPNHQAHVVIRNKATWKFFVFKTFYRYDWKHLKLSQIWNPRTAVWAPLIWKVHSQCSQRICTVLMTLF